MTHLLEVLRWANVVIAGLVVALLLAGTMLRWETLTPRERRARPWVILILAVIAYGSGEAAAQGAPLGLRIVLMLIALSGFLVAMLYRFGDTEGR